jgi:hypothetical protein
VVPDDACDAEAMLFCNRDIRESGLMVIKFMFSSSWTSSWVVVVLELVEPEEEVLLADAWPAERICWTRLGFACMMLAFSEESRMSYMESLESDPWLPLRML